MISLADDHYYTFHLSNFAGTKSSKPCSANWHNICYRSKKCSNVQETILYLTYNNKSMRNVADSYIKIKCYVILLQR